MLKEKVLSKLNPVHILTTDDLWYVAELLSPSVHKLGGDIVYQYYFRVCLKFENMVRGEIVTPVVIQGEPLRGDGKVWQPVKLEKFMFDAGEKPAEPIYQKNIDEWEIKNKAYTKAQERVWFETKDEAVNYEFYFNELKVGTVWNFINMEHSLWNFTENFVKQLLKQ